MICINIYYGDYDKRNRAFYLKHPPRVGDTLTLNDGNTCKIVNMNWMAMNKDMAINASYDEVTAHVVDNTEV